MSTHSSDPVTLATSEFIQNAVQVSTEGRAPNVQAPHQVLEKVLAPLIL